MDPLKTLRSVELALQRVQRQAATPTSHSHTPSDVGASPSGHSHSHNHDGSYADSAHGHDYAATNHSHPGGGGGAKATYLHLVQHFTTLEVTASANLLWKIPAAATYGQVAVPLDMTKLGAPTSAEMFCVYTNTATSGTNQIALALGASPRAAGTTVVPVASSVALLANSATYPQTIRQSVLVAELGSSAQWLQFCLNVTTGTVGPNVMSLGLVLYY